MTENYADLRKRLAAELDSAYEGIDPAVFSCTEAAVNAVLTVVTPELERRDADVAKVVRWRDTYHRLLLRIGAHIGKAFDPEWLEAEDRGLVDAVELLARQRDMLAWLYAEAVWQRDALRADMGIRQGALNDVLGYDRSKASPTDYYNAIEDVAELKRALALAEERITKTRQALRLDGKWSVQHGALAVRSERDRAVAERDVLRAQLSNAMVLPEAWTGQIEVAVLSIAHSWPTLAVAITRAVASRIRKWAPVSEAVPATLEPARDRLSVVAYPGLDFPDCLTEFVRGEVFAYGRAIEECEGWAQDLDRAYAAPYRDVARWLEGRVEWFREQAAQAQAPSGMDRGESVE